MDVSTIVWRKASRSSEQADNCVEVASLLDTVAIRDSKNPDGGKILLDLDGFRRLTAAIKNL
jgi:hypothetical protein